MGNFKLPGSHITKGKTDEVNFTNVIYEPNILKMLSFSTCSNVKITNEFFLILSPQKPGVYWALIGHLNYD